MIEREIDVVTVVFYLDFYTATNTESVYDKECMFATYCIVDAFFLFVTINYSRVHLLSCVNMVSYVKSVDYVYIKRWLIWLCTRGINCSIILQLFIWNNDKLVRVPVFSVMSVNEEDNTHMQAYADRN